MLRAWLDIAYEYRCWHFFGFPWLIPSLLVTFTISLILVPKHGFSCRNISNDEYGSTFITSAFGSLCIYSWNCFLVWYFPNQIKFQLNYLHCQASSSEWLEVSDDNDEEDDSEDGDSQSGDDSDETEDDEEVHVFHLQLHIKKLFNMFPNSQLQSL